MIMVAWPLQATQTQLQLLTFAVYCLMKEKKRKRKLHLTHDYKYFLSFLDLQQPFLSMQLIPEMETLFLEIPLKYL